MTRRKYTDYERAFIAANYATMSRAELGLALDRPEASIKLYVQRARLTKGKVSASRFKPGQKPWNTGLKGWNPPGCKKGHFKKGHTPHNATGYYDGQVVVRHKHGEAFAYKYRRLSKGRWVLSHRYNWEQAHGPIPKGHLLKCQDGDPLNDAADNWLLLSRRELALQNKIWETESASLLLTPNYLAGTLTKGRPELREAVRANPDLLAVQKLKILLNRTLKNA